MNPTYNADFDPDCLNEDQEIVVKKVKKVIQRKNSKGEIESLEVEVEEEVVIDKKTGQEIRSREKPQKGFVKD